MDRKKAKERLDAIEREAAALREFLEEGVKYDPTKVYVGMKEGHPYIMVGREYGGDHHTRARSYFRVQSFTPPNRTECGWSYPFTSGQECIDSHLADGFEIHEFDDTRNAFQFFLAHYEF